MKNMKSLPIFSEPTQQLVFFPFYSFAYKYITSFKHPSKKKRRRKTHFHVSSKARKKLKKKNYFFFFGFFLNICPSTISICFPPWKFHKLPFIYFKPQLIRQYPSFLHVHPLTHRFSHSFTFIFCDKKSHPKQSKNNLQTRKWNLNATILPKI